MVAKFLIFDVEAEDLRMQINTVLKRTSGKDTSAALGKGFEQYFKERFKLGKVTRGVDREREADFLDIKGNILNELLSQEILNVEAKSKIDTSTGLKVGQKSLNLQEFDATEGSLANLLNKKRLLPKNIANVDIDKLISNLTANRSKILNILVKEDKTLIEKVRNTVFPMALPNGRVIGVLAKDLAVTAKDVNLRIEKGKTGVTFKLFLKQEKINNILNQLVDKIQDDFNEVVLNVRKGSKSEANFLNLLLNMKATELRVGIPESLFGQGFILSKERLSSEQKGLTESAIEEFDLLRITLKSNELTRRVRASLTRRMPKGPVGGPPLRDDMLTWRTGRFVRSVEVFYNLKLKAINYFYSPRYYTHESTGRDPRELIKSSIQNIVRRNIGKELRIFKA